MSLYADYIKERQDFECLENEYSFITYKKIDDFMFIEDLYIKPEARRKGEGFELGKKVEDIAKKLGCKALVTTVDTSTNNWEASLQGIFKFGFNLVNEDKTCLYFNKELTNG